MPGSPLTDRRGPRGRAVAIRDAIRQALAEGASPAEMELAIEAASSAGLRWTCPECGEVVQDRGASGGNPAEDEPGHAEGCQRLAAAVAEWLAQGD